VAVISDTAGVADEALNAAILVSPHDITRTARALGEALDLPRTERTRRLKLFRDRVAAWTSRDWLAAQLADLERHKSGARQAEEAVPSPG
jgi:trehalose 6-phosphate synthase